MTYKYRVLLVLVLSVLIFCSQFVLGQSKTIRRSIIVKDSTLHVGLKSLEPYDCSAGPGSISLTISGGTGAYTVAWTGPDGFAASTKDVTNLQAGVYHVNVSDGDCRYEGSWEIKASCPPQVCVLSDAPVITPATACNKSTGSVSVTISGGSGNYSYTWYDNTFTKIASTQNLIGVMPGYYILYVEDLVSPGCSRYFYYTIKSSFKISYSTANNSSCAPPYNGNIKLVATGGSGVYVYTWTLPNGKKKTGGSVLSNLHGGTYQVEVLDVALGCRLQQPIYVFNPANGLTVNGVPLPGTTCSPANGGVDITVSNGSGNYLFTWISPDAKLASTSEDLTHVAPGQYNLFLNDTSSACTAYKTYNVDNKIPNMPVFDSVVTANTNCSAPFNGSITVNPKEMQHAFLYSWTSASGFKATTRNILALTPDDYTLVVTDSATGCTRTSQITIKDQSFPRAYITIDRIMDVRSCTSPNGGILASVESPDKASYSLSLANVDNATSAKTSMDKLDAGTYMLTATLTCNRAPIIVPPVTAVKDNATINLKLSDFITDSDNNLDTSSFQIIEKPISGAGVVLQKGTLHIDYGNINFSGTDKLTLRACDLLNACTENTINITVDPTLARTKPDDIIVYNAVSANHDELNAYLRIENVEHYSSKVSIYDRWGDTVFAVNDYNNAISCKRFEGVTNDGRQLPAGTYFYKIEFADNRTAVTGYLDLKTE